jgi:energy-coupling factor transporter transmembrane protein EcfT
MFGMTFIFFIIGFIFSHAYLRPVWLKVLLIFLPFAGIAADVLGWYVTKVFPPWAWVVMIAGAVNGLAFATMWVTSMYQMWIYKLPPQLRDRHLPDIDG